VLQPRRLAGVSQRYGWRGRWVLDRVDLELPPGGLVRIEGGNGSGKSTLLRLVAGIGSPARGRVSGGGRRGYVPERFPAVLPLDAFGYLCHLGAAHGLSPALARRRAGDWLDRLDAAAWAGAPMRALSKGTSQKIAVIQALLAEPDLLVLDEAWTGLDAVSCAVLEQAVDERLAAGAAVVFVEHDRIRMAGRPVAGYRIEDAALLPSAESSVVAAEPEPQVEIETEDAGGARRSRIVPAEASDAALRELLASPGLHVRSVRPLGPAR